MGFGVGPRNCIGMKFALIELKMAICKILINFIVEPGKDFPYQLEIIEGVVRSPKSDINVVMKERV